MFELRLNSSQTTRFVGALVGLMCFGLLTAGSASARDYFTELLAPHEISSGKPINVLMSGASLTKVAGGTSVGVSIGPFSSDCATNVVEERGAATGGGSQWEWRTTAISEDNESARLFRAGVAFSGKPVGIYRVCAYIYDTATGTQTYAWMSLRGSLDVRNDCLDGKKRESATKRALAKATKRLKKARKQLSAAKKQHNYKKIAKAKAKKAATAKKAKTARKRAAAARKSRIAQCR